ncbi:MAG: S8 family peptidase [Lachnospiraceae bacterium]|nr:S8 family peptidase [Lachnospiraceae bacterium]
MERVRKQLHIEEVHEKSWSGRNVTVCVLDTGVYLHKDLKDRIVCFEDFTQQKKSVCQPYDDCGHGTHVCGILAGNGAASRGKYKGVATQSNLVVGKILDQKGKGDLEDLLTGLEWVLKHHKEYKIRIVNVSVGMQDKKNRKHLLQEYLTRLYEQNIMIVTAAGNMGPKQNSLSMLGEDIQTICVGCHDGNMNFNGRKKCEYYSGRGPSIYSLRKPDVVAPGTEIVSCSHKNPYGYVKKSGTSMACPIVSGLAALYLEKYPDASVRQLMQRIQYATVDLGESWSKQGYGMIDALKVLK